MVIFTLHDVHCRRRGHALGPFRYFRGPVTISRLFRRNIPPIPAPASTKIEHAAAA